MNKKTKKKPLATSTAPAAAPADRVVHAEEMSASLGEVLAAEHVEEAIELLYVKDALPPGEAPVDEAFSAVEEAAANDDRAARDVGADEIVAAAAKEGTEVAEDVAAHDGAVPATATLGGAGGAAAPDVGPEAAAAASLPLWKRLSPFRVARAAKTAVTELRSGVDRAVADLKDGAQRARQALAL